MRGCWFWSPVLLSPTMAIRISEHDRARLRVETKISLTTICKWASDKPITGANAKALRDAAKRLGIKFEERVDTKAVD